MTREQFDARFTWTVDSTTGCWTDLVGEGVWPDRMYPARVGVHRGEGAPPTKHGGHMLILRANRLAYETFVAQTHDPPHAKCGNRACFNPEHLEPRTKGDCRKSAIVWCPLCRARVPREQTRRSGGRHYVCRSHGEEKARAAAERKAKEGERRALLARQREARRMPETLQGLLAVLAWDVSESECWVSVHGDHVRVQSGYGYLTWKGHGIHRLVYSLSEQRPLEHGEQICHKCDNPGCINPAHLFSGTRSDNTQDARSKGRLVGAEQKITEDQVWAILDSTESSYQIAPRYGLTSTQVRRIKAGTRWRRVYRLWQSRHALSS